MRPRFTSLLYALIAGSMMTVPATALDGYVFVAPGSIGGRQFTNGTCTWEAASKSSFASASDFQPKSAPWVCGTTTGARSGSFR